MAGVVAAKLKLKKQQQEGEEAKVNLDLVETASKHLHDTLTNNNDEHNNDETNQVPANTSLHSLMKQDKFLLEKINS